MANCKFLRQKKQVKINGEWVDTRSYRYLPYCDGGTPGVRVRGCEPNGEVVVFMSANDDVIDTSKTISLDANGNGYLSLESNDIVACVDIKKDYTSSGIAEISGCYAAILGTDKVYGWRFKDIDELIVDCARYHSINATHCNGFNFEGKKLTIQSLDTSNETNMHCMFANYHTVTSLDVSKFNTSNVTDMSNMFGSCTGLTSLDVSSFDTSNVTDMGGMFSNCSSLQTLDVSNFDTSNVTSMNYMFDSCDSFRSLDLSNFDTRNVTKMHGMFEYCYKLESLDVSNFNTSNVTYMSYMFLGCTGLTSLDVSSFDTSNVTDMSEMFEYCYKLESLNLSNFNISNVTDARGMFIECQSLQTLDISGWDLANAETGQTFDLRNMFDGCKRLNTIYMRNCSQTTIDKIKEALSDSNILYQVTIIT